MSDPKKFNPQNKRPQTGLKSPITRQISGIKPGLNKTLPRKSKLPGLKNVQPLQRLSKTQGGLGKTNPAQKQGIEEIEKEIETSPVEIKEMLEQASVEQRAMTMIEDTLYLFNNINGLDNIFIIIPVSESYSFSLISLPFFISLIL